MTTIHAPSQVLRNEAGSLQRALTGVVDRIGKIEQQLVPLRKEAADLEAGAHRLLSEADQIEQREAQALRLLQTE